MSDSLDVGEHALDWSEDVGGGLSDKNVEKFYNNIWGVRKRDSLQILTL